jgi:catechol 2,3-dioxygenase-like lactoylglutathione lyase family enzyme
MTVVATMGTPENKETILGLSRSPTEARIILLSGTSAAAPASGAAGFGRVIFRVVDVAAVRARLMAAGYAVGDIRTAPTGHRVLIVSDPDGYGLELVTNPK